MQRHGLAYITHINSCGLPSMYLRSGQWLIHGYLEVESVSAQYSFFLYFSVWWMSLLLLANSTVQTKILGLILQLVRYWLSWSHKLQTETDQIFQLLQSTSPMVNALIPAFRITPLRSFSIKSAGVPITSRPGQLQLAPVIKTVRAIQMSNVDLLRMGYSDISP